MSASLSHKVRFHPQYRWLVLVTVAAGMMMAILSSSIVNIALPDISTEFGSSISTTAWVASIYMIMQATFMPVSGRAGDIFGHKRIFIAGLLLFAAMSVFCTFAWNAESLIAGRGIMAIGTSALSPMSLAFVMSAFPGRDRAQALGLMGGLMGAAPTVGFVSGGFLVQALGWRSVFLIAVPLCALIAPVAFLVLREYETPAAAGRGGVRGFDVPGAALLSSGLFCGLMALSQGGSWGWNDARTLAGFAAFAVLLALFLFWETRAPRPMIDLGLFRIRSLVSANITAFFSSGALFGAFVLLPFLFQTVAGNSPAVTGLKMAPLALTFLLMAPLGGRLTGKIGARNTPLLGLSIAAIGIYAVSRVISVDVSTVTMGIAIAIMGVGLGLTNAPVTTAALHDAPADKQGVASSLPQMSRFVGGSFAIAIVSAVLSWRVSAHLIGMGVPAAQAAAVSSADSAGQFSGDPLMRAAFSQGFQDVFLFTIVLVALAMLAAAFIPRLEERE
ncbi:MAG: DHA2 family efflux MFS transporter permease subunit [Actinobacteria bacterium]|nr:DHA2 family efflux MFS transporter permease subunit [Actinomycetota bacterium]